MSIPKNREEFKDRCLRELGSPVIKVDVHTSQIDDRIDDALYRFYERHAHATELTFLLHTITSPEQMLDSNGEIIVDSNGEPVYTSDTDTERTYIQLPDDVEGVVDVFRPAVGIAGGSMEFASYIQGIFKHGYPAADMLNYYITMSNIALLNYFFNPELTYDFNHITKRLYIAGGLKHTRNAWGGVVVKCFRKLDPTEDSMESVDNIWGNRWLQEYTVALIERNWGKNLSKYRGVTMIGGVQMRGDDILERAEAEIVRLEEQLRKEYEYPAMGFFQ